MCFSSVSGTSESYQIISTCARILMIICEHEENCMQLEAIIRSGLQCGTEKSSARGDYGIGRQER